MLKGKMKMSYSYCTAPLSMNPSQRPVLKISVIVFVIEVKLENQ